MEIKLYTYVPVLSGGYSLPEVTVKANSSREANDMVWKTLTSEQQDNCEYLDWVDTKPVTTEDRQPTDSSIIGNASEHKY